MIENIFLNDTTPELAQKLGFEIGAEYKVWIAGINPLLRISFEGRLTQIQLFKNPGDKVRIRGLYLNSQYFCGREVVGYRKLE